MSDKPECGNAQKMREALQAIVDICDGNMGVPNERLSIYNLAKAVLSATPRNCDVGTAEEQVSRHCKMCTIISRNGTRSCDYSKCNKCFAEWGQMPYEKEVK